MRHSWNGLAGTALKLRNVSLNWRFRSTGSFSALAAGSRKLRSFIDISQCRCLKWESFLNCEKKMWRRWRRSENFAERLHKAQVEKFFPFLEEGAGDYISCNFITEQWKHSGTLRNAINQVQARVGKVLLSVFIKLLFLSFNFVPFLHRPRELSSIVSVQKFYALIIDIARWMEKFSS